MLEPNITRLNSSDGEGIRVELHGGRHTSGSKSRKQQAVIDFLCDPKRGGESTERQQKRDDEPTDGEGRKDDNTRDLQFKHYGEEGDLDVLKVTWSTKWACDGQDVGTGKSNRWGFFTWLIIL